MKVVAIIMALAVSVVGVLLFARGVTSIVGVIKLGRPSPGRDDQPGERWRHMLAETLGHTRMLQWNKIGVGALVRLHRLRRPLLHLDHRVRAAVRPAVRAAGHRPLGGLRVGQRVDRLGRADLDRVLDHRPGAAAPAWPGVTDSSAREPGRPSTSS